MSSVDVSARAPKLHERAAKKAKAPPQAAENPPRRDAETELNERLAGALIKPEEQRR